MGILNRKRKTPEPVTPTSPSLPKRAAPHPRVDSMSSLYKEVGVQLPPGASESEATWAAAVAAMPEEVPPLPPMAEQTRQFRRVLRDLARSDPDDLLKRLGTTIGRNLSNGVFEVRWHPSVFVTKQQVTLRTGVSVLIAPLGAVSNVVDFGAGLNGVVTRIDEALSLNIRSVLLLAGPVEAAVVEEMIRYKGAQEYIRVMGRGFIKDAPLLADEERDSFDLAIASRIHGAGKLPVMAVVDAARAALKPGGVLVMQGPLAAKPPATNLRDMTRMAERRFGSAVQCLDGLTEHNERGRQAAYTKQ